MCIVYKNQEQWNIKSSYFRLQVQVWVIIFSVSQSLISWYSEGGNFVHHLSSSSHYSRAWVSSEPLIGQALSVLAAHWSKFIHFEWVLSKPLWQGCKLQSLRNRQFNKYFLVYYEQEFNMFAKKLTLIPVKASSLIFEN